MKKWIWRYLKDKTVYGTSYHIGPLSLGVYEYGRYVAIAYWKDNMISLELRHG
jgi:hypothetical protein